MNLYRMFFVQTSTRPPNVHLELTKRGRFYEQNNQLPTKSQDELRIHSTDYRVLFLHLAYAHATKIHALD